MIDRRNWLIIAILAVIAFAAWMEVWLIRARNANDDFVGPPRSDYTLNNFTLDALDQEGAYAFSVKGPRMARRGDDGSSYIIQPDYEIIDNGGNTWKGKSESAWIDKDGNVMKLEGAVAMHRVATETVQRVDVLSSDMTITTDPKLKDAQGRPIANAPHRDQRMETAAPTTIFEANSVTHSIGMKADLDLKTTEMLSDVHMISLPGKR